MKFLAKKVNREKDYDFLYHATSRFVRFSTAEVFRRIWEKMGTVTIGSDSFSSYWQTFCICWGFQIFLDLLIECGDILPSEMVPREERFLEVIQGFRKVPIITRDELQGWPGALMP